MLPVPFTPPPETTRPVNLVMEPLPTEVAELIGCAERFMSLLTSSRNNRLDKLNKALASFPLDSGRVAKYSIRFLTSRQRNLLCSAADSFFVNTYF